ncbi:hypothetical protein DINM_001632 [Dirofilaria immitis]|nr:hypothetical protein [Dirofilaria immitis]
MPHRSESLTNLAAPIIRNEQRSRSRSRNRMIVERTKVRKGCDNCIGDGINNGGYMQVEISMAVETTLNDSAIPYYEKPIKIQCEPIIIDEQSHRKERHDYYRENREEHQLGYIGKRMENSDEWISPISGDHIRYRINENYGSVVNDGEKRTEISYISDIDETNAHVEDNDENDKDEDSITDDDIWSKSGSLREFLSDYENIINGTNQSRQASERTGESGYRSESTTYEETVSTTRYADSTTPEFSSPIRNTSYYNPSISIHLPTDSAAITTETTITTTTAIKKSQLIQSLPTIPLR